MTKQSMTIEQLNALSDKDFVIYLADIFEHSPWVAEAVLTQRPFANRDGLHRAMTAAVNHADTSRQLALIRAHPELAGKAAVANQLTAASQNEQHGAGLDQCTPAEFVTLKQLNQRYQETFGFPFIMAIKGYHRTAIIREFARRVDNDRPTELHECLRQISQIAAWRLQDLIIEHKE